MKLFGILLFLASIGFVALSWTASDQANREVARIKKANQEEKTRRQVERARLHRDMRARASGGNFLYPEAPTIPSYGNGLGEAQKTAMTWQSLFNIRWTILAAGFVIMLGTFWLDRLRKSHLDEPADAANEESSQDEPPDEPPPVPPAPKSGDYKPLS